MLSMTAYNGFSTLNMVHTVYPWVSARDGMIKDFKKSQITLKKTHTKIIILVNFHYQDNREYLLTNYLKRLPSSLMYSSILVS